MPAETLARSQPQPAAPDEADYRAFCAALSASARGRAFLAEYARRNRHADTKPLLHALERLQTSLVFESGISAETLVRQKLRALLDDITAAQNEIEASVMAIRTAKLTDLVATVEQRIAAIMASAGNDPIPAESPPAFHLAGNAEEETRAHLAVVPPPDQPELPIPAPAPAQPPPIALVRTDKARPDTTIVAQPAATIDGEPKPAIAPAVKVPAQPSPPDPFASIMALSEEERIAMFT